jgi:hypothetical protein
MVQAAVFCWIIGDLISKKNYFVQISGADPVVQEQAE